MRKTSIFLATAALSLSALGGTPATADVTAEQGLDVIYRHVLKGSDTPLYVKCSNSGKYKAIWRGQWSTDKCGADFGDNITKMRVPIGYKLKYRPFECGTCRPWTLGPGVYDPITPDRAVWLVKS